MQPHNSPEVDANYFEKANMLEAVAKVPAGVGLLQWLVRLTGFNKSSMSMEDAARRDVWLTIRRFVPVELLSEIEHSELRREQQQVRELLEQVSELEEREPYAE